MRKWPALNLMELWINGGTERWNRYLDECHRTQNLTGLAQTLYRLQAGMDDMAKQKLNTDKMVHWFIRLQRSLEITAKKIIREKYPNPCDDPLQAKNFVKANEAKKKRDLAFEKFLRESSY